MFPWRRPVSFVNARVSVPGGVASRIRFSSTILSIDEPPRRGDTVVDLGGAFVIPGLINAHDHLELNHYGALKRRERYVNASDWIDDLGPVLKEDPVVRRNMAFPLRSRLLAGAVKNVLAGVTTVAHHNPRYREIGRSFPMRVVEKYGWAHSFALEGKPVGARGEAGAQVAQACAATPASQPFIVHAGEGVDERAAGELDRLDRLSCLRDNTVLVHGVAITPDVWRRLLERGSSLVWCPASNLFLFGRTARVREFFDLDGESRSRVCLGTDSRLTGARDLLDEMRIARAEAQLTPAELMHAVTEAPARALKLPHAGRIAVGGPADLVVLRPLGDSAQDTLVRTERRHIELVAVGGRPIVGGSALRAVFKARRVSERRLFVDGGEKVADSRLVAAISASAIEEPGVRCA